MPLWQVNYFELIILSNSRHRRESKNKVVVESLSHVWLFETPWTAAHQASLSFTISWSLLKLMPSGFVVPFNHLILCHPLLLLPSIIASINIFFNKSALHIMWSKYWSFCFIISLSNGIQDWFPLGMNGFDLLSVKGTLKSLLQHHNLKATILWAQFSLWSNFHIHTWLLEKQLWLVGPLLAK